MELEVIGIGLVFGFIVVAKLLGWKIRSSSVSKMFKEMDEEALIDPNNPLNPHFNSGIDEDGKFRE